MIKIKTKSLLIILLIISAILNAFLGFHIKSKRDIALDNVTCFANLTLAGLNGLVDLTNNPHWEDPAFKMLVYDQIVEAEIYARAAHQMVQLTTGTPSQVSSMMGELSFRLQQKYTPVAVQIANTKGTIDPQNMSTLINLVNGLRQSGWPLQQVQDIGWSKLKLALDRFLSSET